MPTEGRPAHQPAGFLPWFESILQDVRFGLRMLWKDRVVSGAAILSLALAIGASTGAFSLIDALILRPLPVDAPDRLFSLSYPNLRPQNPYGTPDESRAFSYPLFERLRQAAAPQAELFGINWGGPLIAVTFDRSGGQEEKVRVEGISADALATLGVRPALGRAVLAASDRDALDHPVAVISHSFWMRRFGGSRDVLDRWVTVRGKPLQIVGVAEPRFTGIQPGYLTDVWIPMMLQVDAREIPVPSSNWFRVWGRLKPGVQPESVRQALQAAFTNFRREQGSKLVPPGTPPDFIARLIATRLNMQSAASGADSLLRWQFQRPLLILGLVALLVLLIACSNIANLFMARAATREREMAMRISIGAGRLRLIRQLLIESSLVAIAACALGLLFAGIVAPPIVSMMSPADFPVYLDLHIQWRLLGFLAFAGMLATAIFGIAPAVRASAVSPDQTLRAGAGGGRQSARIGMLRPLLMAQVGFSLSVLFLAGLMLLTFRNLKNVDLGYQRAGVILLNVDSKIPEPSPRAPVVTQQLLDHLRQIPNVQSAGMSGTALGGGAMAWVMVVPVSIPGHESEDIRPLLLEVSPGFFETMQIRLISGRDFEPRDLDPDSPAVIVNQTFAQRYFAGQNPVGQHFDHIQQNRKSPRQIVGVIADVKYNNSREPATPTVYVPLRRIRNTMIEARTAANPLAMASTLRSEVARFNAALSVTGVSLQSTRIDDTLLGERMLALLAGFFAIVALALAAVGLYGVLSYSVARRTKEIGIRIALGARQAALVRVILLDVTLMLALGIAAGLAGGVALSRFVATILFEVKPADTASLVLPVVCLLVGAGLAALRPAIRAARVDPMVALRQE